MKRLVYLLLMAMIAGHLLFLTSDPDQRVDVHTRGAFTDEGLYSAQARNFVNSGSFGFTDNSTLVRGPLFGVLQIPFFAVAGTSRVVARLITLVAVMLALWLLAAKPRWRWFALLLAIIAFTHFRVFQFSHYAMAEMVSIAAVAVSFLFLHAYFINKKKKNLTLAALMIFVAYGLKIQFAYLAALLPVVVALFGLGKWLKKKISFKTFVSNTAIITGFTLAFALLYFVIWYQPNQAYYDAVMAEQTGGVFEVWERLNLTIHFNYDYYILDAPNIPLLIFFGVALLLWILSAFGGAFKIKNHLIILFGFIWTLGELHKLGMLYLPQRYLLGLYVAAGFFAAAVVYQFIEKGRIIKIIVLSAAVLALLFNGWFNLEAYNRRSWQLQAANDYLQNFDWNNRVVAGAWAPSIAWGTAARTMPVWAGITDPGFLQEDNLPAMIVMEADQADSELFYDRNNFDLQAHTDSMKTFDVWKYKLELRWISPIK
ncbi:MAG: hypothetical protein EOM83_16760 [Clostridia bacterium]|nr:hypothetical protein [Clostridia bacterium]